MTKPRRPPLSEILACRAGCNAWLANSLHAEPSSDPLRGAARLLLAGGLSDRQAVVAQAMVWLDRALPVEQLVSEARRQGWNRCFVHAANSPIWHEVETEEPSEEEFALSGKSAKVQDHLDDELRKIANQCNGIEGLVLQFCDVGMSAHEAVAERIRKGRVLGAVEGINPIEVAAVASDNETKAVEAVVQGWQHGEARWDEIIQTCAALSVTIDRLRELTQLRRPRFMPHFLDLRIPRTLDEWRASRRELEMRLADVGFEDPEIAVILPDGAGDARRRVEARRRRMKIKRATAAE